MTNKRISAAEKAIRSLKSVRNTFKESGKLCGDLLKTKKIDTETDLFHALDADFQKFQQALWNLQNEKPGLILEDFFEDDGLVPQVILKKTEGTDKFDHFAFEVYTPLSLFTSEMEHWIREMIDNGTADTIEINKTLRFPASPAFQKRVKANVEVMRIWMKFNDEPLVLELFDIHYPVLELLPDRQQKNTPRQNSPTNSPDPDQPPCGDNNLFEDIFQKDDVWHYAISLGTPDRVTEMHEDLTHFVATNQRYKLPYTSTVYNKHDGSFHTKIIHRGSGKEIEFSSQK